MFSQLPSFSQLTPGIYTVTGDHVHLIAKVQLHGTEKGIWICRWMSTGKVEAVLTDQFLARNPVRVTTDDEGIKKSFIQSLGLEFVPTLSLLHEAMGRVRCAVILLQGVRNTEISELLDDEKTADGHSVFHTTKGPLAMKLGMIQLANHDLMSDYAREQDSDGSEAWKRNG